jgi:hypothetical protein
LNRIHYAILFLCGFTAFASPGGAGDDGAGSALPAVVLPEILARPQAAHWSAEVAPGSLTAPAADTRQIWNLAEGWVKLPLAIGKDTPAPATPRSLPDAWSRSRNYDRAWYVFSADLGASLPASLWLNFETVAHQCRVFVNGRLAGEHLGGYTPFAFDLTRLVHPGTNTITLWVRDESAVEDTKQRSAVSQLGVAHALGKDSVAGVRGAVYLESRTPVHAERTRVQTSTRKDELSVQTWVRPADSLVTEIQVSHAVYEWPDGAMPVLQLPPRRIAANSNSLALVETVVPWQAARRWSPEHPHLYTLRTTVRSGGKSETTETRFGFREFWIEGKQFMLNGQPLRLRGPSQEHELEAFPPAVARTEGRRVLEFMKREFHYNAVRLHAHIYNRSAVLAADEAGYLVTDQSSIWSSMVSFYERGGDEFLHNMERQFAAWYWRDVNSPSVVIWDVENEMIRDQRTPERERWVLQLDTFIKQLDPAAIVEHSGDAWYHPPQEIIHVHMQEQYGRVMQDWERDGKVPLVLGEFWMGGRGETRLPNAYEYADREDWHTEEARIYREKMLEMRYHGVSGIMPFRLHYWPLERVSESRQRGGVNAAGEALNWRFPTLRNFGAGGLAPVVGFVWPRSESAFADTPFAKEIVVCNDREAAVTLTVACDYGSQREQWPVTLGPAEQQRRPVKFTPEGTNAILVTVTDAAGQIVARDRLAVHVIPRDRVALPTLSRQIVVVPAPTAAMAAALRELGLNFGTSATLPTDAAHTLVLVTPGAPRDALGRRADEVRQYLSAGGRLLVLGQTETPPWLPLGLAFWPCVRSSSPEFDQAGWPPSNQDLMYSRHLPLYAPGHPVFAELASDDFKEWSARDGRVSDDAYVRPNAVGLRAGGPYRVLAGATRRENASLVEARIGLGTMLLCQAQVVEHRAQPAARVLLMNLLRYLDGPAWAAPIQTIGLVGDLSAKQLAELTGMETKAFVPVTTLSAAAPALIVAGDKADAALLTDLAQAGRTVLVLSCESAGRLPGYTVATGASGDYSGTRSGTADEPLFWGVASASFLPLNQSPAKGVLTRTPATARCALSGLRRLPKPPVDYGFTGLEVLDKTSPLAVVEPRGAGRLIVTTLEPWNAAVESHRQLLTTLLANAGVDIPNVSVRQSIIPVKRTVPLRFDGQLGDWTSDMEDRAVSQFVHATPVVLTSQDTVNGVSGDDLDQSAVLYLLHDAKQLYLGGIVFAADEPAQVELTFGEHRIVLDLARKTLVVDGQALANPQLAIGRQPAHAVIDTRRLTLMRLTKRVGNAESLTATPGGTFELAIPWSVLGGMAGAKDVPVRFRVVQPGRAVLSLPNSAAEPALTARF